MRTANLSGCLSFLMACFVCCPVETQAHNIFKKSLESKLGMKIDCNACHVVKKPKTERNSFGGLFYNEFKSEELTKNWKAKTGADKKDYETKIMIPAFEKATAKVLAMTVEDMIKAGMIDGIKSTTTQTDSTIVKSRAPSNQPLPSALSISPAMLLIVQSNAAFQPAQRPTPIDFRRLFISLFKQ